MTPPEPQPWRVLVATGEPLLRRVLTLMLNRYGTETGRQPVIMHVESGLDALRALQHHAVGSAWDIAVLDNDLSVLDAVGVLHSVALVDPERTDRIGILAEDPEDISFECQPLTPPILKRPFQWPSFLDFIQRLELAAAPAPDKDAERAAS